MSERGLQASFQRRLVWWWVLVGSIAVLSFAGRASSDTEPDPNVFYRYDTFLVGVFLYVLLLGIVVLISTGLDLRGVFALRRPESWTRAGLIAGASFVAMWTAAALLELAFHAGEEQGLDPDRLSVDKLVPFLLNVVLAAIVVPVTEELIYRGLGFTLLAQFGDVAAIVVTSVAFALAHGIVDGLPVFFVIGASLATVRSRTQSIYPCMLMHGVFNAIQVLLGAST